jgi:hypothetical protein
MLSRFLALFVLVGTTFAQTATAATEGKMPGNGAKEPEAEVPRKDGFHRITKVSRPALTLFLAAHGERMASGGGVSARGDLV